MGATDFALTFPSLITDERPRGSGLRRREPHAVPRSSRGRVCVPFAAEAKIDGFVTKRLLRLVARGVVPDSIVDRPDKMAWAFQSAVGWQES